MAMQEYEVTKLRILVPDSKHVSKKIAAYLTECGVPLKVRENGGRHLDYPQDDPTFPNAYTLQKNTGIPELVAVGRFPAGFTTTDRLADYRATASYYNSPAHSDELPTSIAELLNFEAFNPGLRVSVLVKDDSAYKVLADLNMNGREPRVATSYMGLAREYFEGHNVQVQLDGRGGKEEELVRDGDADAAVVVVEKGTAMRRNMLRELGDPVMGRRRVEDPVFGRGELILVLICNPDLLNRNEKIQLLLGKLMDALQSSNIADGSGRTNGNSPHMPVLKGRDGDMIRPQIPA